MRVDVDAPLVAEWMSGRKALVTGGGGRDGGPGTVGSAIARTFARHGASVAVLDRDRQAAERTVSQIERAGGRAVAVLADVFNDEECARAVTGGGPARQPYPGVTRPEKVS
jgi:NAD(P)-dependent dehydrogenase (short-subunit alcohol dehydrogenase family)